MEQIQGIFFLIVAFINLVLAFWLLTKSKEKATFHLGLTAVFSAIFCFSWAGLYIFEGIRVFFSKLTSSGFFIVAAYIVFVYYFSGRTKHIWLKMLFWYGTAFAFVLLTLFSSIFITSNLSQEYPYIALETAGPFNFLYRIYVVFAALLILFYLLKKYKESNRQIKSQIKYFLWGLIVYLAGGSLTAGLIPLLYPQFYGYTLPLPVIFSIFWIGLTVYAIVKEGIFGIKIIFSEIFIGFIGLIIFIQFLVVPTLAAKALTFFLFVLLSVFSHRLIKVTYSEIEKREESEKLTKQLSELNAQLEKKVEERTSTLEEERASLEVRIRARTRELEELTEGLERKIKERTSELQERVNEMEGFHKVTVGRELKMIELKEEIERLKKELEKLKVKNKK